MNKGVNETPERLTPADRDGAAELMRSLEREQRSMRICGGGTKLGWGSPVSGAEVEVSTAKLDRILEHNEGDFTAVVEAGVTMAELEDRVGRSGQRLALDPPLGEGDRATVGGVTASADAGPLRHRYGAARDLVLGVTVVLPDGSLAKAGGKVIKNVAGYDLPKLYSGSFGTLGMIVELVVRLHPIPARTVTVLGRSDDPEAIAAAAWRLADSGLEPDALDVRWGSSFERDASADGGAPDDGRADTQAADDGRADTQAADDGGADDSGAVLVRLAGAAAPALAQRARKLIAAEELEAEILEEDEGAWHHQRERQRSESGAILKVSAEPAGLAAVLRSARAVDASVVGRAAHGVSWLRFEARPDDELADAIDRTRADLAPAYAVLLDAPEAVRYRVDPWALAGLPEQRLMRSVKSRFDPQNACNPGLMGAGI